MTVFAVFSEVVRAADTTIVCSPEVEQVGGDITCSATVSDAGSTEGETAPSGTIQFKRNGEDAGQCTLEGQDGTSRSCSIPFTSSSPTVDEIEALYPGDGPHEPSQSEPTLIVFYDPSAGFVTGGGWVPSPASRGRPGKP